MEVDAVVTVSSRMASVADIPQHKMNIASNPGDASSELWAFSLVFYQQPDVMSALLALQDGAGLDVNLILFALWLGLSGRGRVDDRAVDAADRSVRVLRDEVIEPLRALRAGLKSAADADILRLREGIKALEIDAEKAAQDRLAALAGPAFKTNPAEWLADAEANLALYCRPRTASGPHAAIIRRELSRLAGKPLLLVRPVRPSA
jgi:uncharacterized protein (TIGR02444 family)